MDNRRLILAVVLSFGVLAFWAWLFPPKKPVPKLAPPPVESAGPAAATAAEPAPAATPPAEEALVGLVAEASGEETVSIETDQAVVQLSNRGAQLVSYRLKSQRDGSGNPLDLVRRRDAGPYPFALLGPEGQQLAIDQVFFEVVRDTNEPRTVKFRYGGSAGRVEKVFTFGEDGLFDYEVTAAGIGPWAVFVGPGVSNPGTEELGSRLAKRSVVYLTAGAVKSTAVQSSAKRQELAGNELAWIGLEDNYFLTVLLPRQGFKRAVVSAYGLDPGKAAGSWQFTPLPASGEAPNEPKGRPHEFALELLSSGSTFAGQAYWGAKELSRLSALGQDLERTIELGSFRFLALPFLLALRWLHDHVVSNYGWAIVLLTVLIRLALLPLTHKSMVSMKKMQELQPKMQAIEAKYAGKLRDKQGRMNLEMQRKKQEEQMAVYSAAGANPVGGCLPMLLQFPVFIAFYSIFPAAVELRHAPWILWIHDLSARDPYYLLPIIMGAAQLGQQLMMPATGNPMQRRLMMILPLVFTVLFAGFPSGLQLYWLTNNVFGIAQQTVYNRVLNQKDGGKEKTKKSA